jgi:hypothetical protein
MIKIERDLSANQKVSSQLALIFILVLSCVVAWYTVSTGEKIADKAKETIELDMDRRVNFLPVPVSSNLN